MSKQNLFAVVVLIGVMFASVVTPSIGAADAGTSTLADMVAAGRYDWTDQNITEKDMPVRPELFTTDGLRVFRFTKPKTSAEVEAAIRKEGYKPATLEQLLAYGAAHPEEQRAYPIVALGSSMVYVGDRSIAPPGGDHYVPCLYADAGKRFLTLYGDAPGYRWGAFNRFLAFRSIAK